MIINLIGHKTFDGFTFSSLVALFYMISYTDRIVDKLFAFAV